MAAAPAILLLARPAVAVEAPLSHVTQRRINSCAAALLAARQRIVDATGLRRPSEPLPAYLARALYPLPGESRGAFVARLDGYAAAIERAADATAALRSEPELVDRSAGNARVWTRATKLMRALASQAARLRIATDPARRSEPDERRAIAQGVALVALALDDLRDALP